MTDLKSIINIDNYLTPDQKKDSESGMATMNLTKEFQMAIDDACDLELIKKCAKQMEFNSNVMRYMDGSIHVALDDGITANYDPLHDDAQVMALVKQLRLSIFSASLIGWIVQGGEDSGFTKISNTDLNRAIVECVARMDND